MESGTRPRDDESHHNSPGYPREMPFFARRKRTFKLGSVRALLRRILGVLLRKVPNVPPSSGEYSTGTPQGGAIHQDTRNGVYPSYGDAHPHLSGSSRLQRGAGYAASSGSLLLPRSPSPSADQPYPLPTSSVPHQQNPVVAIATSSQYQDSTFVQDASGTPYYRRLTSNHIVFSSPGRSALQLPAQPQPFNMTNEHNLPPQMPLARPHFGGRGKRKALIIGINYTFHSDPGMRLRYCIEDAYAVANFLDDDLGFARENIRIMTDEYSPWYSPTKENILREMEALVHDAQPNDSFFIYFSGHAVQVKDLDGDESDGLDECICAMDYCNDPCPNASTGGLIVDDIMHEIMVRPLPEGCRLTAIFDSCNSGTLLDLPHLYNARGDVKEFRHPNRLKILRQKSSYADAVSLGATKDGRNALETERGGALRRAFIECLTAYSNNLTYKELIRYLREDMKTRNIPQRPLLSSSYEIDTNLPFII